MKQTLPTILALLVGCSVTAFVTMNFNVRLEPANHINKPVLSAFIDCVQFQSSIPAIRDDDLPVVIDICMPDEGDDV